MGWEGVFALHGSNLGGEVQGSTPGRLQGGGVALQKKLTPWTLAIVAAGMWPVASFFVN